MNCDAWLKRNKRFRRIQQPRLPLCGHEVFELLDRIVAEHFQERIAAPPVYFGNSPTLAHIEAPRSEKGSSIWIHHALNSLNTPDYVFSLIFKHELLHTRIASREVEGKLCSHPPEFWEEEDRIAGAEKDRAWKWIWEKFAPGLKLDREAEAVFINKKGMSQLLRKRLSEWDES